MKSLVVEDDFVSRRLLQRILADFGEADVAVNGEEALAAFQLAIDENAPYEVICLDIHLPGVSGQEVLKRIRAKEEQLGVADADGVKVIMTTGLTDKESVLKAFRDGCEAYIKKPFSRSDILSKLTELGYANEDG